MNNWEKWEYINDNVSGTTTLKELEFLAAYASQVPMNGLILDIGTCEGRSAFALCIGAKNSVNVVTIDPTPNSRFYNHRLKLDFLFNLFCIEKTSEDTLKEWVKPIDMFFHDGLHTYHGMKKDIELLCPRLKKGAICIFHDFKLYDDTVGKAILEFENKCYKRKEIIDNFYIAENL